MKENITQLPLRDVVGESIFDLMSDCSLQCVETRKLYKNTGETDVFVEVVKSTCQEEDPKTAEACADTNLINNTCNTYTAPRTNTIVVIDFFDQSAIKLTEQADFKQKKIGSRIKSSFCAFTNRLVSATFKQKSLAIGFIKFMAKEIISVLTSHLILLYI